MNNLPILLTYFSFTMLVAFGHTRDFFAWLFGISRYPVTKTKSGYAVLLKSWESFFTRRLYHRIQDCWNRPVSSAPKSWIDVVQRESKDGNATLTPKKSATGGYDVIHALNLGSYNYLGFADDWNTSCKQEVMKSLDQWPISMCSSRSDLGNCANHMELESIVAKFLDQEAALVFTMGYGTNATTLPALMGPGSLIVSDTLNHTSIVNGSRGGGATIQTFQHNNPEDLDKVLKRAINEGKSGSGVAFKKILVCVEGIYSMEGSICKLAGIRDVCKKYMAYLYVDEAHSIGALGNSGKGVCEETGVSHRDVDVLMGTFTKSFSGMGGYIAGSKEIIDFCRVQSAGILHHTSLSPIVTQQVIRAFKVIEGAEGTGTIGRNKIDQLKDNANYFRKKMKDINLHVYGDNNSPIIPVLVYFPGKVAAFSRECLKRGVAIVVVGFPATSIILSRARFCISAGHTRADLDYAIKVIDEVTNLLCLKYNNSYIGY